jgi:hypothetical protein
MLTGKIFITSDFSDVRNAIANGATIVALVDEPEKYRYINCVIMGNLLPPYESLSAEIDGSPDVAANIYYSYLMSKIPVIANILAAMNMNKNIVLFVPEEESMHFGFVRVLLSFFLNVFGITISTSLNISSNINDDPVFIARRADALFVNNLIPFEEYCLMMPLTIAPSENACAKIMHSINYRFNSMPECISYCGQYIAAIQQQQKQVLFSPVFRVKP